jgi:hypothetical protein
MKKKVLCGHDLSDIHNFNEDLVVDLLEKMLFDDKNVCKCHTCIEDMYALALKLIEPQYHPNIFAERASQKYLLAQQAFKEKAESKLREAIERIKKNPHH